MKADTTTTIYLESRLGSRMKSSDSNGVPARDIGNLAKMAEGRDRKENRVERKVGRKASPARVDNYLAKGKGLEMGPVPTRRHEHVTTVARPATCRNNAGQLEEEQPTRTSSRRTATTPRKPRRVLGRKMEKASETWSSNDFVMWLWAMTSSRTLQAASS